MKIVFWKFRKFQNICERESGRGSCFQRYTVNSVSARGNRRAGAPPVFIFPRMFENFESFKIISSFLTFSKKWLLYNSEIPKCFPHFNNSTNWNICSKLLLDSQPYVDTCFFKNYFFHCRIDCGALVPSRSLSCCFNCTFLLGRNLQPLELLFFRAREVGPTSHYSSLGEKYPALRVTLLLGRISCPSVTLLLERNLLPFELLFYSWGESPALRVITFLAERSSCSTSYYLIRGSRFRNTFWVGETPCAANY